MREIGYERGMVVYGKDPISGYGMDEISVLGETVVHEFSTDKINNYAIHPEEVGINTGRYEELAAMSNLRDEAVRFVQVLAGVGHKVCIDFTCLNAGAILYLAGKCDNLQQGVEISRDTIERKLALDKLQQWVSIQGSTGNHGIARLEKLLKKAGLHNYWS